MSFLDNLENSLKAFESAEQASPEDRAREARNREAARESAVRRAPYVEQLRHSEFTEKLLGACRVVGHQNRVYVQITWIDTTLRLDAKTKRLELQPTEDGIVAVFQEDGKEIGREPVAVNTDDAEALARRWLEPQA